MVSVKEMNNLPPIGATMYAVTEWLYYDGDPYPRREYLVCPARVTDYKSQGWKGIQLLAYHPVRDTVDSVWTWNLPLYYKPEEIGAKVFYTPQDAARRAKELTDKAERSEAGFDTFKPYRRSYEKYLEAVVCTTTKNG